METRTTTTTNVIGNLRVGKPDVRPTMPSHTPGVREGNKRGLLMRERGLQPAGGGLARATPRRSTGVNPSGRQPIDPRMPVLTPP